MASFDDYIRVAMLAQGIDINSLPSRQTTPVVNPQTNLPYATDPNSLINPYYTRQAPSNDLSPMQMYQQYKQTGQTPQSQGGFQPWVNAQQPAAPAPVSEAQAQAGRTPFTVGGK